MAGFLLTIAQRKLMRSYAKTERVFLVFLSESVHGQAHRVSCDGHVELLRFVASYWTLGNKPFFVVS